MKRLKIGDIVEIRTTHGLAYAQFIHKNAEYGTLVRALKGYFETTPTDLNKLAMRDTIFHTFVPLGSFVYNKTVTVVGNALIPDQEQIFPTFRNGTPGRDTKVVENWWLWDGVDSWLVGALTPEQWKYPLKAIWNAAMFIDRTEEGWTQEGKSW
jgi:hypothetical protein